jgi:hypothetical protein
MKKLTAFVFAVLMATAPAASAQDTQILFVSGNAWETGGFPPSNVGDIFACVGILNDIGDPLIWDTENYSYTWYVRDLVSLGESIYGPVHVASYSGGLFTVYVDWLPSNHDYGINPPNATVPSTFNDGISTYLDGFFTDFTMNFNDDTQSGTFNGTLTFTGGDVFPLLSATEGWTFGSNLAGVSPLGYDVELNGQVELLIVAVEEVTWGGIKALYR